jgi:hypothetical protein
VVQTCIRLFGTILPRGRIINICFLTKNFIMARRRSSAGWLEYCYPEEFYFNTQKEVTSRQTQLMIRLRAIHHHTNLRRE